MKTLPSQLNSLPLPYPCPLSDLERETIVNLVFAGRRALNALNHPLTEPAACLPIDEIRSDMQASLSDAITFLKANRVELR